MKKILIFALVCALATGVLFFGYLENLESAAQIAYEDVVVASTDIAAYSTLTPEMLTVKKVPQATAHPKSARDISAAAGMITEGQILAGEEILPEKLKQAGNAEGGLAYAVPHGMRAITLDVSEVTGAAFSLRKGDLVDVMVVGALENPDALATEEKIQPAAFRTAECREIVALGANVAEQAEAYDTVTLLVTPQEAQRIAFAKHNNYAVQLVLRSAGDTASEYLPPLFLQNMHPKNY